MNKAKTLGSEGAAQETTTLTITLQGRNPQALEKTCTALKRLSKEKNVIMKGPVRMPTKVLRLTTRKSPCGEGTNTWDRFEMRIHKRVIHITGKESVLSGMAASTLDPEVKIKLRIREDRKK